MIACCPQCQARFRLAPEKVGAQGVRIRCSKCQTIFRVPPPGEGADASVEPPAARPAASAPTSPASSAPPSAAAPKGPRVLVAETDAESAKQIVEVLGRRGLGAEVRHDGAEALLWIYRNRPPAAVLGGHLPSVSASVIAELVRRTSELSSVRLIRVAPLEEPVGAPEFEADRTVEPGELAHGIEAALEALDLGTRPEPKAPESSAPPAPEPTREAPAAKAGAASADPEIAAAERLARIIISDIVLYNQEKFQEAARSGNVAAALEAELAEASTLFRQRIPEQVRAKRDFLVEELERRAGS